MKLQAKFPAKLKVLFQPKRYKVLHGGRGGAKSWGIARALLLLGADRPLRILCAREVQKSIADSVHRLLCDQIAALRLEDDYDIFDAEIRGKNGTLFAFAGLRQQGVTQLKSYEGFDICWVEEAQAVTKRSWDILIPTIRKPGSEIWISFNPELDTDETWQRFVEAPPQESVVVHLNYSDNPWFPEVLEAERLALKARDPKAYENVWEGKPKTVVEGAIYHDEVLKVIEERRIRPVPYDPVLRVHTIWDLGWNDAMAIICVQRSAAEVRVIDYIEDSHKTLTDYLAELEKRPWRWGKDWLPHDGRSKNLQTGKSPEEILRGLGRNVEIVPNIGVEQGIAATRSMFPRVYFNEGKPEQVGTGYRGVGRLVECLKRYRRQINQQTGIPGGPLHDEYSHGSDAFRGLGVIVDKITNEESGFEELPPMKTNWIV